MTVSDESWAKWEQQLNIPADNEYLVLGNPILARIYVSREGTMTRAEIAAQLRRLADYVDNLPAEEARRP